MKESKIKALFVLVILLAGIGGISLLSGRYGSSNLTSEQEKLGDIERVLEKSYVNTRYGFALNLPEGWIVEEVNADAALPKLNFISPQTSVERAENDRGCFDDIEDTLCNPAFIRADFTLYKPRPVELEGAESVQVGDNSWSYSEGYDRYTGSPYYATEFPGLGVYAFIVYGDEGVFLKILESFEFLPQ